MMLGPILSRELLVAARSARTYSARSILAFAFLAGFCAVYEGHRIYFGRDLSIQQVGEMARLSFMMVIAVQGIATLLIVPQLVCGSIAREKDGKTLGFLLATPMGPAEIVLGKLGSRLLLYVAAMAILAPFSVGLMLLSGFEPAEFALSQVAILSTALTLGSFAILASTLCRGTKQATQLTTIFVILWIFAPFVFVFFLRLIRPGFLGLLAPVADWLFSSSPLFFTRHIFPLIFGRGRVLWLDEIATMFGLQTCMSIAFLSLAIWRLRPTYRDQEGNSRRTFLERLKMWRWRLLPKPPVGDAPVFWRETATSTTHGLAKLLGLTILISGGSIVAYLCVRFGWPAFREVLANGYSGDYGPARTSANHFFRALTVAIVPSLLAILSGSIASSVPAEKERDTWLGLIATELSGREILRSKRRAALFRVRYLFGFVLAFWLLAVAVGSLHPVGLLIGLALVGAWSMLALGLGSWASMRNAISGNASGASAGLLVCLWVLPTLLNCFEPLRSMLPALTCFPWLLMIVLFSYRDVATFLRAASDPYLTPEGLLPGSSLPVFAAILLLGIVLPAVAGWALIRHSDATFDRLAGRPIRPRDARA